MSGVPQNLDWVGVPAACSVKQVFSRLYDEVEGDVAAANRAFSDSPGIHPFEIVIGVKEDAFTVRRRQTIKPSIAF